MAKTGIKVHLSAFESWLASRGRSERTVKTYLQALNRTLGSLGVTAITDVTPIDLAGWRRQRASEAKPATVNVEIDALRQFFRFSFEMGLVHLDPTDHLRRVPQVGGVAPRWLDRKEQHRLIRAAQQARQVASTERQQRLADRDAAIVALMLHAGLRVSEVCMLNTADVILSERKGAVTVRQGKGGKRREVPLNNEARQALARWKERLDGEENKPLFPGAKGGRLTTRAVQAALDRLGVRAGLKLTPHELRHTFCHELVAQGVPLDRVALLAGHTTADGLPHLQATVRYTLPDQADLEAAVAAIEWS